jgi:hypothetical protein
MVVVDEVDQKKRVYFLSPFENILISRCQMSFIKKTSFTQNSHKTFESQSLS